MRELILDHGAEFGAHRIHEDGKWDSEFKQHLKRHGMKPILARVKHPQTNGKLGRWFGEYQKHRLAFSSFKGIQKKDAPGDVFLLLATGCLDYDRKYELFTRIEIGAGAKYFQDYSPRFYKKIVMAGHTN